MGQLGPTNYSGDGSVTGFGPVVVTDIEAVLVTPGSDIVYYSVGPPRRLFHAGFYAVGVISLAFGGVDITYWRFLEFSQEDFSLPPSSYVETLVYSFKPGTIVSLTLYW